MADSQILGLFTSPEQYQANQMAQFRQQAANEVQLSPFQQAAIGMRQAGYQLGGGIGGALGGVDPQLQKIARRQALAGQLDPSNPQSYMQVAKMAADVGDQEFAIAIADAGRKVQADIALVQQRTAEKMTGEQRNSIAYADSIATRGTPEWNEAFQSKFEQLTTKAETTSNEQKNAASLADAKGLKRGTPEWNAEYQTQLTRLTTKEPKDITANIKEIGVAEGTRAPVYLDVNKDLQFTYQKDASGNQVRVPYIGGVDRTTAKVSATASSVGETEFTKTLGKADAERVNNAMTLRDNSISALTTLQNLSKLDEKGLISGSFATGRVGAANILATVGLISEKDAGVLANSQNYQKISGDLVLATLGGKLGSGFSNEDRKFILSLVPQLETNAQARKQLIDFMVKKNNDIVTETTRLEDYARDKKSLKGYVPKIPIFNTGGAINKPVSQMTKEELLNEKARLQSK